MCAGFEPQGGAEAHPYRGGSAVGGARAGRGQAASPDQHGLVPCTLPPDELGGVKVTSEQSVWRKMDRHS